MQLENTLASGNCRLPCGAGLVKTNGVKEARTTKALNENMADLWRKEGANREKKVTRGTELSTDSSPDRKTTTIYMLDYLCFRSCRMIVRIEQNSEQGNMTCCMEQGLYMPVLIR